MMNLILDIGNTRTKVAIFDQGKMIELKIYADLLVCDTEFTLRNYPKTDNCILSCTGLIENNLQQYLINTFPNFITLTGNTALPFNNNYQTKNTQGSDRIAAIAGAQSRFPNSDILIIDAGTAITFDFIDAGGNYNGGNISPGLETRFKALHTFTEKLPLMNRTDNFKLLGSNTNEAIISGVQNGIIFEIEHYIDTLKQQFPLLQTIITGGDADFLANKLKSTIFVDSNLVLNGLNRILEYNAH